MAQNNFEKLPTKDTGLNAGHFQWNVMDCFKLSCSMKRMKNTSFDLIQQMFFFIQSNVYAIYNFQIFRKLKIIEKLYSVQMNSFVHEETKTMFPPLVGEDEVVQKMNMGLGFDYERKVRVVSYITGSVQPFK